MNKLKETNANVHILWTGGWDSTYRMVELSRTSYTIQPIYVYGDGRISEKNEIKAMEKILNKLKKHSKTTAEFLPVKYINKSDIVDNNTITEAYETILKKCKIGSQHEWLARLAYECPGLEIGTEKAPLEVSNILKAINLNGRLIKNDVGEGYVLDTKNATNEGRLIFGNLIFPIVDKTGKEMRDNIEKWGYEDIMRNVWVCHNPFFNQPCGFCHPCELKIETGMDFVLSPSAIKRYYRVKNKKILKLFYKVLRKLSNIIT